MVRRVPNPRDYDIQPLFFPKITFIRKYWITGAFIERKNKNEIGKYSCLPRIKWPRVEKILPSPGLNDGVGKTLNSPEWRGWKNLQCKNNLLEKIPWKCKNLFGNFHVKTQLFWKTSFEKKKKIYMKMKSIKNFTSLYHQITKYQAAVPIPFFKGEAWPTGWKIKKSKTKQERSPQSTRIRLGK